MTAATFMTSLAGRGVVLEVRGDRLAVDAPVGVIGPELRAELVERRAELIALLSRRDEPSVVEVDPAQTADNPVLAPWPPRPPELANWAIGWRSRWGRRSAELEDFGLTWREAEQAAFLEVLGERVAAGLTVAAGPDEQDPVTAPGESVAASIAQETQPLLVNWGATS